MFTETGTFSTFTKTDRSVESAPKFEFSLKVLSKMLFDLELLLSYSEKLPKSSFEIFINEEIKKQKSLVSNCLKLFFDYPLEKKIFDGKTYKEFNNLEELKQSWKKEIDTIITDQKTKDVLKELFTTPETIYSDEFIKLHVINPGYLRMNKVKSEEDYLNQQKASFKISEEEWEKISKNIGW
jgi:hypothetical protein